MDTQRSSLTESTVVVEKFTALDTVTIALYDLSDGAVVPLDSASCAEIAGTGLFRFPLSNITTFPTAYIEYTYEMSNGASTKQGKVIYFDPDDITSGANQTTITVEETDTTPIPDVEVQVYNSAETVLLGKKDTDASGQVVFALNDGSYKVRLYKSQVDFTVPEDLTVSGTTVDTYNGTVLTITTSAGAGECEVSLFSSSQRPTVKKSFVEGFAKIVELPEEISGVYYPGDQVTSSYDTSNGRLYWILPQGATVLFKVNDLGISQNKTIPASTTADYKDLVDA